MTAEQFERLLAVLTQISGALTAIAYPPPRITGQQSQPYRGTSNGYACPMCGSWVLYGTSHGCYGVAR